MACSTAPSFSLRASASASRSSPQSAPVSIERDGRLLGHADAGATLEILAHPNAARVMRGHSGGFAERARRKLGITDPAGLADFDLAGHER